MIVAILNYHSSIITIMAKDDNMLCINYTIKTGTVREQMRNLLKRLLFSSRQAFLLSKTACKAACIHINKHSSKKHDGRMEPSGTITLNFLFSQPYI